MPIGSENKEYITNTGWQVTIYQGAYHITPMNDIKYHYDFGCSCRPDKSLTDSGIPMFRHWSFDGREFFEETDYLFGYKTVSFEEN